MGVFSKGGGCTPVFLNSLQSTHGIKLQTYLMLYLLEVEKEKAICTTMSNTLVKLYSLYTQLFFYAWIKTEVFFLAINKGHCLIYAGAKCSVCVPCPRWMQTLTWKPFEKYHWFVLIFLPARIGHGVNIWDWFRALCKWAPSATAYLLSPKPAAKYSSRHSTSHFGRRYILIRRLWIMLWWFIKTSFFSIPWNLPHVVI